MGKKVIGILIVGLLMVTVFPVTITYFQKMIQKEKTEIDIKCNRTPIFVGGLATFIINIKFNTIEDNSL